MSRVAIYRVLYGEDFVKQSINSIIENVDHVFVFYAQKPWGKSTGVNYRGKHYEWPEKFDNIVEKCKEMDNEKIHIIEDQRTTPKNQYALLAHRVQDEFGIKISTAVYMEPDQVFGIDRFKKCIEAFESCEYSIAAHQQIELWKSPAYRIAKRNRLGAFLYNIEKLGRIPTTGFSGSPDRDAIVPSNEEIYNFGFCFNKRTMFWKHLTAIAFSAEIGDSKPSESWYEEKWLNWTINTEDLEISERFTHTIKRAVPCPFPYAMRDFMSSDGAIHETR